MLKKIIPASLLFVLTFPALAGVYSKIIWDHREISVCFAPGEEGERFDKYGGYKVKIRDWSDKEKSNVENWINEEYTPERTRIHFVGWRDCQDAPDAEVVLFKSYDNKILKYLFGGIVGWAGLGGLHYQVEGFPAARSYVTLRSTGIKKSYATHEFGHVVGLGHESINPHATQSCGEGVPADKSIYLFTAYDADSIMSYCVAQKFSRGLSEGDLGLIRTMYPAEAEDI